MEGKISLFNYDDEFEYEFGQKQLQRLKPEPMVVKEIHSLSSEARITLNSSEYKLQKNEVIQLVAPNIVTEVTYGAYIGCHATLNVNNIIKANTEYRLKKGESIVFVYDDSEGNQKISRYNEGDIIKSNFNIKSTIKGDSGTLNKKIDSKLIDIYDLSKFINSNGEMIVYILDAKEEILKRRLNEININYRLPCYWIRSNPNNTLFTASDKIPETNTYRTMLKDNEYFYYSNDGFNSLTSFGSGTIIEFSGVLELDKVSVDLVDFEELSEKGLLSLQSKWKYLNFDSDNNLSIKETSLLTLTEGDSIKLVEGNNMLLSNKLVPLEGSVVYTINNESKSLSNIDIGDIGGWSIKSRLDIHSGRNLPQTLLKNQRLYIYTQSDTDVYDTFLSEGETFNLNNDCMFVGDDYIDLSSRDLFSDSNEKIYPFDVYRYKETSKFSLERNQFGFNNFNIDGNKLINTSITIDKPVINNKALVMVQWIATEETPSGENIILESRASNTIRNGIKLFTDELPVSKFKLTKEKQLYILEISANIDTISVSVSNKEVKGNLIIGKLNYYTGINKNLGISNFVEKVNNKNVTNETIINDLKSELKKFGGDLFYYNNEIDSSKVIEVADMTSPFSLYDYNNVFNKFTISEIDFDSSTIDVVRSSRK